jgi:hypothetical protein
MNFSSSFENRTKEYKNIYRLLSWWIFDETLINVNGVIWSRHPMELFSSIITAVHRFSMFYASPSHVAHLSLLFLDFLFHTIFLSNLKVPVRGRGG